MISKNVEIAVPSVEQVVVPIVVPIATSVSVSFVDPIAEPISKEFSVPIDKIIEPLHSQPSVIISEKKYHDRISQLLQFFCINCHELWPSYVQKCHQCQIDSIKYSIANNMIPDFNGPTVKKHFEMLTMVEEMLISPLFAIMSIYHLKCGQLVSKGHVANFSQDLSGLCNALPRLTKSLPVLIVKRKNQSNDLKDFKVNRERVYICLKYLIANNKYYRQNGVIFNHEQLNLLPIDDVPLDLQTMENDDTFIEPNVDEGPDTVYNFDGSIDELNNDANNDYQSFVDADFDTQLEQQKIFQNINWPDINPVPINEFEFEGICSLLFPKLFFNGFGDPTSKTRLKEVTESLGFKHLLKFACRDSDGKYYYPFAQHPRFKFWAYDRLRRHRSLGQCRVFLKNNNEDNNLTIGDLKTMLTQNTSEIGYLMNRMSAYSANITGSNSYWFQKRRELESIFEQKKCATVFFTFSFADNHWSDLHNLMPGNHTSKKS